jgi:hypothetical protein
MTSSDASTPDDSGGDPAGAAEDLQRLQFHIGAFVRQADRLSFNAQRVRNLLDLFAQVSADDALGHDASDILRAAVVLLHASIEDYLRSLAAAYLPLAHPRALSKVPLALSQNASLTEFNLSHLARFRGKTVDQVIEYSVQRHLAGTSYSSTDAVTGLLTKLEIDPALVRPVLPRIGALMQRRHDIAHRADLARDGTSLPETNTIAYDDVIQWTDAVEELGGRVAEHVVAREVFPGEEPRSGSSDPDGGRWHELLARGNQAHLEAFYRRLTRFLRALRYLNMRASSKGEEWRFTFWAPASFRPAMLNALAVDCDFNTFSTYEVPAPGSR